MIPRQILVLGAAYGLLPSVRLVLAGHAVTVVCRNTEQAGLVASGATVNFLDRHGAVRTKVSVAAQRGKPAKNTLGLASPDVDPGNYDLVLLAMGEPHYADPDVAQLIRRVARSRRPVISLMNLLPPPFLARLGTLNTLELRTAYEAWNVWQSLDPDLVTAASPDAQAVRLDPENPGELAVTLASNFKVAPFQSPEHNDLLQEVCQDVSAYRFEGAPLPVRIQAHSALHVPLSKWPMLIAGNCRCLRLSGGIVSIRDAVAEDPHASRAIYDWALSVVSEAGADPNSLVPFDAYYRATAALSRPSSFARAISSGAKSVERVDKMVQLAASSLGLDALPELDAIVEFVDERTGNGLAA